MCTTCHDVLSKKKPELSKFAFTNYLPWFGRHPPLHRDATLAHQLVVVLGRVVSTKVYLSSKGVDESVCQGPQTWRQKFLQQGIKGIAIVYGNATWTMQCAVFRQREVVQDTFAAVFIGPESPSSLISTFAEMSAIPFGHVCLTAKHSDW